MPVFKGKKQFLFLASFILLVFWSGRLSAQTTATATLMVKLDDIQSILVSTAADTLEYSTTTQYLSGFTKTIDDHLTVTSTGDFTVSVSTSGANLVGTASASNLIPVSNFQMQAAIGTHTGAVSPAPGLAAANITTPSVTLSTTSTTLIGLPASGEYEGFVNGATFNITYTAAALAGSLSGTTEPDKYTTTLTYTITPG